MARSMPCLILLLALLAGCTRQHAFVPGPNRTPTPEVPETVLRQESNFHPEGPRPIPVISEPEGIDQFPYPAAFMGLSLMADRMRVLAVDGQTSQNQDHGRTQILSFRGYRRATWVEALDSAGASVDTGPRIYASGTAVSLNGDRNEQVLVYGGYGFAGFNNVPVSTGNPMIYVEESYDPATGASIGRWKAPDLVTGNIPNRTSASVQNLPNGDWWFVGGHDSGTLVNSMSIYRQNVGGAAGEFVAQAIACTTGSAAANRPRWTNFRTSGPTVGIFNPKTGQYELHLFGGKTLSASGGTSIYDNSHATRSIAVIQLGSNLATIGQSFPNDCLATTPNGIGFVSQVELPPPSSVSASQYIGADSIVGKLIQRGPYAGQVFFTGGTDTYPCALFPVDPNSQTVGTCSSGGVIPSARAFRYNPLTRQLVQVADMPTGRFGHAMAEVDHPDGVFIVYSGSSNHATYNTGGGTQPAWIYNTKTDQWTAMDSSPLDGRTGIGSVQWLDWTITFNGFDINTVFWVGGQQSNNFFSSVFRF